MRSIFLNVTHVYDKEVKWVLVVHHTMTFTVQNLWELKHSVNTYNYGKRKLAKATQSVSSLSR